MQEEDGMVHRGPCPRVCRDQHSSQNRVTMRSFELAMSLILTYFKPYRLDRHRSLWEDCKLLLFLVSCVLCGI